MLQCSVFSTYPHASKQQGKIEGTLKRFKESAVLAERFGVIQCGFVFVGNASSTGVSNPNLKTGVA